MQDELYHHLLDWHRARIGALLETSSDQRPYDKFVVALWGSTLAEFHYQLLAFDSDGRPLSLPDGIKKFFVEREAANTAKMCLDILALGKTKHDCDVWARTHKREE